MSGFQFEKENVLDARLVNEGAKVEMVRGSASTSKNTIQVSGGSPNTSAFQWNVPITSSGLALDTFFYGEYQLTFDISIANTGVAAISTGAGPFLRPGVNFSMAPYPVSSLMGNSSISINEQQIMAYDVGQYRELLLRMTDTQKLNPDQFCPSLVESSYAHYADAYLTNSNASSSFADHILGTGIIPNGAFPIINAPVPATGGYISNAGGVAMADNGSGIIRVIVNVSEPLLIAPCSWDRLKDSDGPCPFYVRTLNITCPINVNANRFFRFNESFALDTTANTARINVTGVSLVSCSNALLHYTTLQPALLEGYSLPMLSVHHTMDIVTNNVISPTAFAATRLATVPVSLTNQNVTGMPRYIVIGAKKDARATPTIGAVAGSGYSYSDASWFFPISNLVVSLGNEQNIMATYSQQDLFAMSRKNGLKCDYVTFTGLSQTLGTVGAFPNSSVPVQLCSSPIIIDVRDLKLPYNIVNGSSGNFVFNFTATIQNTETTNNGATWGTSSPMLAVAFLYDSYICTDASTLMTVVKRSFLSPTDPLEPAQIKSEAEVAPDGAVVGGAIHRMRASHAGPTNLSKSAAVARLNKRIM